MSQAAGFPAGDAAPGREIASTRVHAALGRGASAASAWLGDRPLWLQALLIWAIARLWSALVLVVVDRQAPDGPWGETPLGYFGTASIWDGTWYEQIHDEGYPGRIPRDPDGAVQENAWAFHPLFPLVVRGLTALTGAPWTVAAPLVALLAGFGAAVAVAALFQRLAGPRDAVWALALVAFCAVSPVLQTAYAESLHLALLALALLLILQGRAVAAMPVVLLMCLTRPAGVPFAAALGIAWAVRALPRLREHGPRRLPALLDRWFWLAVWACACALAWPAIAWAATGEMTAYTETETAWRGGGLVPVEPWLQLGARLLGQGWGWLFAAVLIAVAALLLGTRVVRRTLPQGVRLWAGAYAVYLLLFLHPQSSTLRLLLPLFVVALPLTAVSESRAYRWTLLVVGALSQLVWVGVLWQWSPLPQGGDYPP
ncbi:hypothetical protein [Kocuria palustris]|uniref:hypothetical protein n=1 Tax=Kocuria palustris TaxID=71999 RepID=UPI00119CB356|nr:hypothetical protein [Kocuria palustris]